MNVYELDVRARSRIYRVWVVWPKSFWKGAETESFHDYVYVMISDASAAAAMTISFCCSYHPAHEFCPCIGDYMHRKTLSEKPARDVTMTSKC
jgi:hypothetical protein